MEKSIIKFFPQNGSTSSDITTSLQQGEKSRSPAKSPENLEKKFLTKKVDILTAPAHQESLETDIVSQDEEEEEINLHLESSDEETFEGTLEDVSELRENKTSALEKYFSDIESSDDSQVYEPKSKGGMSDEASKAVSNVIKVVNTKVLNKEKTELDFELVESEEDFEESRSQEEASIVIVEGDLLDTEMQSQVLDESNGALDTAFSTKVLSDEEEDSKINERNKEENKECTSSEAAVNTGKESSTLFENEKNDIKDCGQETKTIVEAVDVADSQNTLQAVESDHIHELREKTNIPEANDPPGSPTKSSELMEDTCDNLVPLETNKSLTIERKPAEKYKNILQESEEDIAMEVDTDIASLNVEYNASAQDKEASSESMKKVVESQEAMEVDSDLLRTVEEVDSNKKHNAVGDDMQPEAQTSLLNKSLDKTMQLTNQNQPSKSQKTVQISVKATEDVKDASGDDKSVQNPIQSSASFENADVSVDVQVSTTTPIQPSKAAEKAEASADLNEKSTETSIQSSNPKEMSDASAEDSAGNHEFLNKAEKSLETSTVSPEIQHNSSVAVDVVEKSQGNQKYLTGDEATLNVIEKIPNVGDTTADDISKKEYSIGDENNLGNSQQSLETPKDTKKDEQCEKVSTGTERSTVIPEDLGKPLEESVVKDETLLDTIEITANAEKSVEDLKSSEREQIDEQPTGTTTSSDILIDTDENSPKAIDACTKDLTRVDELPKKPEKSLNTVGEESKKAEDHIDESAKATESAQNRKRNLNDSTKPEKSVNSADEEPKKSEERRTESAKNLESAQIGDKNVEDFTKADKTEQLEEKVDVAPQKEKPLDKCTEDSEQSVEASEKSSEDAPSLETAEKSLEKHEKAHINSSEKPTEGDGESVKETVGNSAQGDEKTKVPKPADVADISTEKVVAKEMAADSIKKFDVPDVKGKPHINEGNCAKSAVSIDPEIIEIDDDDDLEDDKKEEPLTASNRKPAPSTEVTEVATVILQHEQSKSLSAVVVPIEKTTEKAKGSTEKPTAEAKKVTKSAVPQDIEMLGNINDKDKTATMKAPESVSAQAPAEEDESLLIIDTSHKEDNEPDDIDMDTETEQTVTSAPTTTDSSSEGSLEIFYDKECVHYECKHGSKNFYRATLFTLNYYKISKKRNKAQYVCEECYDRALSSYEEMCKTLTKKQPLLHGASFKRQEFVEIIDSSEEDDDDNAANNFKDENVLPKDSIELLEAELEGAIRKVMHNVDIQNQLSWTKQILQQRLNNLQEDTAFVSVQLRQLQKKADNMHNSLYQCPKIKIRQLTPLDLNSGRTYNPETESTIPPMGEVLRTSIHVNETYYAVKNKAIASWVPCKVIEAVDNYNPYLKNQKHFKIKFLKSKYPMLKTVSAKHMAFFNPPKVRLPIGTRVIAYFDVTSLSRGKEKLLIPSAFYPGIIAEPLKQSNKFRYLVFYDDGYFQYVYHKDVRLVCQASENVWEDVHHQSREFIHNYLTQYAVNRPMVQTQKGQSMLVDYNGKWIYARVIDVDCSLVQMLFEGQSRSEWIYRGSTRLGPVYKESNNLVQKNQTNTSRLSRRTEPFIRYINGDDSSSSQQSQEPQPQQNQPKPGEVRSVAKKSVSKIDNSHQSSQPVPTVRHLNNSTIFVDDDNKPKGKVVYYTARKNLPPRDYEQHICSPTCPFNVTHNLSFYSPLAKPLLSGWERQVFRQKSKKFIVYRGPCGKRLRCMEELHRYLRVTENELNVDNFDFSAETNCLAEYVIESCIVQKKDISNGKEKMPIPCVNYYDNTMPPDCIYSSRRIPTAGVPLNLDKDFLVGCDCEDDCSDKSKCSCWELTYAGAKYGMPNVPNEMVGYQYKRLYEHIPTGIYECNARCKCKANCVNRVVQQPLQSKLQVFKTSNRGWGLRCINDVPRGSFICIYAGHLLNEQMANEGGLDAGDEYFAELDYIEVAEQIKEGYESDVAEPDEDEDLYNPDKEEEDDDEFVAPGESHRNRSFNTRSRSRKSTKNSSDVEHDSQERQVISFEPNKTMGQPDNSTSEKPTIRKLFGKDEACYIMDAKITGNLGRYFNHSCSPNLFVQNVFVDTHDLRFPWVAFFAVTHIRAGTELTWNYNYEVGVVPGKVLYCQCGAPNCRQRLL